ncbi:diguanylate cyclase (GGDEF)-like protein [Rhizobium rosettiformans]|uniref:EAL domain-containing protein n=2 Tax=Rhizobium rosettiformans TaxID=1368430 RepID=A0A4S8PR52_9HYPH|nr:EAL domain-containing protein [Rhizobium rosettiformans]MBB5278045.1 diguanylate cyclase (GGDEF)-like protein [Rhizobium rosettiformans]THV32631.1 EAL domain-containing protein [Rhizobium rosettiformans W3]
MMLSEIPLGRRLRYSLAGFAGGAVAPAAMLVPVVASGNFGAFSTDLLGHWSALGALALPLVGAAIGWRIAAWEAILHDRILRLEGGTQELEAASRVDRLTGLGNRQALNDTLATLLKAGKACSGTLLLIDLDRFKYVNDTLGHEAGDGLLLAVANRLREAAGEGALLFRLGADEFAVILPHAQRRPVAEFVCLEIEHALAQPFELAHGRIMAGASIGATLMSSADRDVAAPKQRADLALYRAKEIFGPSHAFYDEALAREVLEGLELERDLSRGFVDGEFYLEYQPIVAVDNGDVRSLEALLRWRHPKRGLVTPDVFIPLAEKTGIIQVIGKWVVQQACAAAVTWPAPTGVSVNVSGDQFKDPNFVAHVLDCLVETGLAPERLTIEVTEAVFSVDIDLVCRSLAELRASGVRVALDDFGTGFSSINNLRLFPLDELKIDRSFAGQMLETSQGAKLVDLMHKLSETFQIRTTIEGIETKNQLDFVKLLGIGEAQGFLFSKPVGAAEALNYVEARLRQSEPLPSA